MREACHVAALVLDETAKFVRAGISTYEIDEVAGGLMAKYGAKSACYNYQPTKYFPPYPGKICISINDEVVHGIPNLKRVINPGDNVSLDVVVEYNGYIGDNARTLLIEPVSAEQRKLIEVTESALLYAIRFAKEGNRVGDISNAVQRIVEAEGLGIVTDFVGHGVGRSMHEEPPVPNYGKRGIGPKLISGMTLAIEPMVNLGSGAIKVDKDGWTVRTVDGKPSAHFEHTVLIGKSTGEILTKI